MHKLTVLLLCLLISIVTPSTTHAQELLYGQRENKVSYDGNTDKPSISFNGTDFATFYLWSGKEDKNSGLHMRRINRDGTPFGPQRLVLPLTLDNSFSYITSVWDGSAYIVSFSQNQSTSWHVVRVDTLGKLLGHKKITVPSNPGLYWRQNAFVVGDTYYLFFSTAGFTLNGLPYMVSVDRELKQKYILNKLPSGGLNSPIILGVALDPEKFVVFLASYVNGEISRAALLHVNFSGKLLKTINPASINPEKTNPAEQLKTVDLIEATGPLYTGDGYLIVGTNYEPVPGSNYPYVNSTLKIDGSGKIIDGPYNIGNGDYVLFLGKTLLLGGYIGVPITDQIEYETQIMLLGKRGRHINDISLHEHKVALLEPENIDAVYAGTETAVAYYGYVDRFDFKSFRTAVYSNIITDPKFVKPSIVYFQASTGKPFKDTRRLVMWSVTGSTDVTLEGSNFEMTNLPPVFHTVVDTNGERTVLRLIITTEDGGTKSKRLIIAP